MWQLSKDGTIFTGGNKVGLKLTNNFVPEDWEVVVWCINSAKRKLLEFKLHLKYKNLQGTGTSGMKGVGYIATYKGTEQYVWNLHEYATQHKLNKGHIYSVANSKRKQHKGHTLRDATYLEARTNLGV